MDEEEGEFEYGEEYGEEEIVDREEIVDQNLLAA